MTTPTDVLRALAALIFGPWIRLWRSLGTAVRRLLKVSAFTLALILVSAGVAWAEGADAPGALAWIKYTDSHGISLWQYRLSTDEGGLTNPLTAVFAGIIHLGWALYIGYVGIAIWLYDWTLSFTWLSIIADPAADIADNLQSIVDRFGAAPTLLTTAGLICVYWMSRGRWALGFFELFMTCVIAALTVGIFANPVDLVAGEDGILVGSRDFGLEVASGLANDGDTTADPKTVREESVGMIIDTFIRLPHQLINYGKVLDGTKCGKVYQEALETSDEPEDVRDAVSDCDEEAGEAADNPDAFTVLSLATLTPSGSLLVAFIIIVALAVIVAGGYAVWESVKSVVALVIALVPGLRGSLWIAIADVFVSMMLLIFAVVFAAAYMLFIQAVTTGGGAPVMIFFIVDIMMLLGIAIFWKGRARIKAARARLAAAMAKRPGAGPTRLPERPQFNPAEAYYKGKMAIHGAQAAGKVAGAVGGVATQTAKGVGKAAGSPVGAIDTAMGRIKFASDAYMRSGAADRVTGRVAATQPSKSGQLVRVGGGMAMAVMSGGTSAVVQHTASQAALHAARRTALQGKLRPLALGPSSSEPRPVAHGGPRQPHAALPPRMQPLPIAAPAVPSKPSGPAPSTAAGDAAARLRARLDAQRAIPMPPSRAIPMRGSGAIPMPGPASRPKE